MATIAPFSSPLYVMLKPAGAHCNLACDYCYYLEKSELYSQMSRQIMTDAILERFTKQYIEAQTQRELLFTWHGGEPLMRPLSFYQRALAMQRRYACGHVVDNCIQTNGTLLTDEWCRFFHDNGWLVGISIDGNREQHNRYRHSRGGKPSFDEVMAGIELLNKWQVEWNAMAVVNSFNAGQPEAFYRFFKEIGCRYLQFTPIVERRIAAGRGSRLASLADTEESSALTQASVSPQQWGRFLCALFDLWVREDVGTTFVQLFDATLSNWLGVPPGLCSLGPSCGHAAVMEHNGDVYSCDHFVFPHYKLGNIRHKSITELLYSDRQRQFGRQKRDALPTQCRQCLWTHLCNGECPKNRFAHTADGQPGLNYLCEGYRNYFSHVAPYMQFMAREYSEGRAPANVMQAIRDGVLPAPTTV